MKLSDKALHEIGREVLGQSDHPATRQQPHPPSNKPSTTPRGVPRQTRAKARQAKVLAFRKRVR
jgi:hypothetical protein